MKKKIIKLFEWFLIYIITVLIVVFGWQGLELLIYGEIQPRLVDDIIGILFTWSILLNIIFIRVIDNWKEE